MKKSVSKLFYLCGLAMLMCLAFVGCGEANSNVGNNVKEEAKEETKDKEEGKKTLTMAVGAELNTLYPLNMDFQNLSATRLCYEGLVHYEDGQVKPWLAESWEFSEDGCTLTFKLREDVTFHDGEKFNAEAVKAEFEFASKNPNFTGQKAVANLKEVEVVDEYTAAFHYNNPYFGYLTDFSYREVMVCVSPKVIEEGNFQSMKGVVGTGPYIYDEIKEGEYVKFVRNENYWGDKGEYDEIIVKYIPESSARLLALKKGEIDMIYGSNLISWDDYEQAITDKNIGGVISPVDSRTLNVVVNASNPILSDISVREAIAYGIDKQAICDGLTHGNQEAAKDMFPDGNFLSDIKLNVNREYDVEKSKELLKNAGWVLNEDTGFCEKEGQTLTIKLTYDSGDIMNELIATTIKSQLKNIGVDVQTEGQDMMTWWKEGVSGNYGMIIWGTEENTEPQNYYVKMVSSTPHAVSLNALEGGDKFIEAIGEFQTIDDMSRVNELFTYMLNFNNDNVLDIPISYVKEMILFNKNKVKDYTFTDTPMMFEIDNLVSAE